MRDNEWQVRSTVTTEDANSPFPNSSNSLPISVQHVQRRSVIATGLTHRFHAARPLLASLSLPFPILSLPPSPHSAAPSRHIPFVSAPAPASPLVRMLCRTLCATHGSLTAGCKCVSHVKISLQIMMLSNLQASGNIQPVTDSRSRNIKHSTSWTKWAPEHNF